MSFDCQLSVEICKHVAGGGHRECAAKRAARAFWLYQGESNMVDATVAMLSCCHSGRRMHVGLDDTDRM
jgi:hypothetical protein